MIRDDDPGEPSTGAPRVSVTEQEAAILTALVRWKTVLEIGTGLGVSTNALAKSAKIVHTLDIDPWVHETIWPTLAPNVLPGDYRNPELGVEVVFIDADHSTNAVKEDIAYARSLRPELIICHDAQYPSVAQALDGEWHHIPTEHGLALQWL